MILNDYVLKVDKISKKFTKSLKRSIFYGLSDIVKHLFYFPLKTDRLRKDEFWALYDISFSIKKGEVLGIIGSNGSGKSTLLKIINGIFLPDFGSIEIMGRTGALIEVGAGFHPVLTGRENIYINGAILGMSRDEIESKFDRIAAFADIGDFLNTPVKNYSSGMRVRLGFSIAVHSDPDILLIDEVLAVGDKHFQEKSLNKIKSLKQKGTSIVLVSHSITKIMALADTVIILDKSKLIKIGDPIEMVNYYQDQQALEADDEIPAVDFDHPFSVQKYKILQNNKTTTIKDIPSITANQDFHVELDYRIPNEIKNVEISFGIYKNNFRLCSMSTFNFDNKSTIDTLPVEGKLKLHVKDPRYYPGKYKLTVTIKDKKSTVFLCKEFPVCYFIIRVPDTDINPDRYINIYNCIDQKSSLIIT